MLKLVAHEQVFSWQALYSRVYDNICQRFEWHKSPRSKSGVPGFEKVRGILADLYKRTSEDCQKVLSRKLARMELAYTKFCVLIESYYLF